jgi:phosphoribosylformylglycinamidine synthase
VYILEGSITEKELDDVKKYLINPVDSREASLFLPDTLETDYPVPPDVAVIDGFTDMGKGKLENLLEEHQLAMDSTTYILQGLFRGRRPRPLLHRA